MEWMLMPLKRYADFSGRSRRQEFWMYMLLLVVIWMVAFAAMMVMGVGAMSMAGVNADGTPRVGGMAGMFASMGIFAVIFGIIWLALLIPTIAVSVRRLHDTDRSGFWLLMPIGIYVLAIVVIIAGAANQSSAMMIFGTILSLLQWVASIVLLVFYCLPGTNGPNRFGADPLGGTGNLSQTFQ
ncbi:MAG: DUF805 domain-containing protein [Sphingomonas sp.]|uniref:DUF805 domain-containing protein n=1 Tax=Sphingomonas sp. TaxID=28214 RepID=UPI003F7D9FD0